jgi:hypothetical protein
MPEYFPSVADVPPLPAPAPDLQSLVQAVEALRVAVDTLLGRRNGLAAGLQPKVVTSDGWATKPKALLWMPPEYTVAQLPAATPSSQMAMVTNEVGGYVLAFSDGTNWRRVTDRAVAS